MGRKGTHSPRVKVVERKVYRATANAPCVSLDEARSAWFVLKNKPYSLFACDVSLFRAFVRHVAPTMRDEDVLEMLDKWKLGEDERFFILTCLKKRLPLFSSRWEAEASIEKPLAGVK
jgi:hypothetical protein